MQLVRSVDVAQGLRIEHHRSAVLASQPQLQPALAGADLADKAPS
jgi:hypothetical protein